MIRQAEIKNVIESQRLIFRSQDKGLIRNAITEIPIADNYATIITGIRRCGKSTLLLQLLQRDYNDAIYLNFDDIKIASFEFDDFIRLYNEIIEQGIKVLFFDEIQIVKGWEKFINQLVREGFKVFITGSNASMLSVELGTHLTGRHLSMELFTFSYNEFLRYKSLESSQQSVLEYLKLGGVPEYVKSGNAVILSSLVDDILMRDIAVRHSVRDIASLRQLVGYLIANIANLVSANKLVGMFDIKSATTFLDYFSYLKNSYLFDFVPQFNYSLKTQARNPKKIYIMDMGLYTENSVSLTDNMGRRLENLVYLHLRRTYKNIYYFKGKGECDFVVMHKYEIVLAIQVCLDINDENFNREYNGVKEAIDTLNLKNGVIVTLNQKDEFKYDDKTINMISINDFLLN